jgi:hypothetical protein
VTRISRRRRALGALAAVALGAGLLATVGQSAEAAKDQQKSDASGWQRLDAKLPTPWTDQVGPDNALPEYPRPQLVRKGWRNLNGVWEFAGASANEKPPFGATLDERVLVPYPIESDLSGIGRHEDRMWYRRTVTVPKAWDGERVLLHFGAVDFDTKVWVNGELVATHTGGYTRFDADITDALTGKGPQEVVVGVVDQADKTWQPLGKQRITPDKGIFYEGASGIWQTVWMEAAPQGYVDHLGLSTDVDTKHVTRGAKGKANATTTLHVTPDTKGADNGTRVQVQVTKGKKVVAQGVGTPGEDLAIKVKDARLWSPDDPFLYDLSVDLLRGKGSNQKVLDHVTSYVGMREIGIAKGEDGRNRITLNGKITFLMSTLDQGYWPDGIYTAPTDDALAFDLEQHKRLGFNTVRKHIKVEPDRWFYHADELGLLVWQDMPAMKTSDETPPPAARQEFERELHEIVDQNDSWTSVIGWIPFNEGWGEWDKADTGRIAKAVKAQDPTRLVNAHSGVNCCASKGDSGEGDVIDWHMYTGPAFHSPDADRVAIDGEHGGYGLEVPGHMWFGDGGAYQMAADSAELTRLYVGNQRAVIDSAQQCGLSGAIYTQITDVEHEVNGFFTYDRQVEKMDFDQVAAVNKAIIRTADGSGTPPGPVDPGTPGLDGVHGYGFDEGTGTTAADAVGDADLALTGTTWAPGQVGQALSFDGAGAATADGPLVATDGSYSVSAWARLDVADGGFQTVLSQDTGENSAFFLQYSGADQRWAMSFVGLRALSPQKPEVGRWYHLTGVRDAAKGTLSLYVDGEKVASQSACAAAASTGDFVVGRGEYGGDQVDPLRGDVDEVRVFDRALSDDEVAQLATASKPSGGAAQ